MRKKISEISLWIILVSIFFLAVFLQIPSRYQKKQIGSQEEKFVCVDTISKIDQTAGQTGGTDTEGIYNGRMLMPGTWESQDFVVLLLFTWMMSGISYHMYRKRFLADAGFRKLKDRWLIRYILKTDGKKKQDA